MFYCQKIKPEKNLLYENCTIWVYIAQCIPTAFRLNISQGPVQLISFSQKWDCRATEPSVVLLIFKTDIARIQKQYLDTWVSQLCNYVWYCFLNITVYTYQCEHFMKSLTMLIQSRPRPIQTVLQKQFWHVKVWNQDSNSNPPAFSANTWLSQKDVKIFLPASFPKRILPLVTQSRWPQTFQHDLGQYLLECKHWWEMRPMYCTSCCGSPVRSSGAQPGWGRRTVLPFFFFSCVTSKDCYILATSRICPCLTLRRFR